MDVLRPRGGGLLLVGQFLERTEPGTFEKDGRELATKPTVRLLVGNNVYVVKYRDRAAAVEALGGADPDRMEWVELPVIARGPFSADREPVRIQYVGRSARAED